MPDIILSTLRACRDIFVKERGPDSPLVKALDEAIDLREEENQMAKDTFRRTE